MYIATLRAELLSPFPVLSDEVMAPKQPDVLVTPTPGTPPPSAPAQKTPKSKPPVSPPPAASEQKAKPESAAEPEPGKRAPLQNFRIDLDGIQNRIWLYQYPRPICRISPPPRISSFMSLRRSRACRAVAWRNFSLHAYDLKDRKDHVLLAGADQIRAFLRWPKLFIRRPKRVAGRRKAEGQPAHLRDLDIKVPPSEDGKETTAGAKPLANVGDGALKLDDMRMELDPPAEWTQIFNEVWRQQRDYFYEPSMNGINWRKEREKYAQLLPYVADG